MKKISIVFMLLLLVGPVCAMRKKIYKRKLAKCNFHKVIPGKVYRCGQLDTDLLTQAIKDFGIKSILNLRTYAKKSNLKKQERELADKLNIAYYHVPLRSNHKIRARSKKHLLECFDGINGNLPVLIHCQHGKNRTSLATASLLKLHFEYSDEKAIEQFDSEIYGFKGKFAWMIDFVLSLESKKQKT